MYQTLAVPDNRRETVISQCHKLTSMSMSGAARQLGAGRTRDPVNQNTGIRNMNIVARKM